MSVFRIAEILELDAAGWTSLEVSGTSGSVSTIKTGAGLLGAISTTGCPVTAYDGATQILWQIGRNASLDVSDTPLKFATSLRLVFADAGSCRVLYK